MLDGSISGSAELSGIKVENPQLSNTMNILGNPGKDSLLDKVAKSINPVAFEKRRGDAVVQRIVSAREATDAVLDSFPFFTEPQALLFALGYSLTPEQSENVFRVVSESNLQSDGSAKVTDPMKRDLIIEGASRAYERDAAMLWVALLAKEGTRPGSISSHTMRLLRDMDPYEARVFRKFCSSTVIVEYEANLDFVPLMTGPFARFALKKEETDLLDEIGLTHVHDKEAVVFKNIPFSADNTAVVTAGGTKLHITQRKTDPCMAIPELTTAGRELALVCGVGDAYGLIDAILSAFSGARVLL